MPFNMVTNILISLIVMMGTEICYIIINTFELWGNQK